MSDRFAVIMAGGSGTRFWPASRAVRPKQFLALGGSEESLLAATVRRVRALVPVEHIFVVTSERHAPATAEQLPDLPPQNILAEPLQRNTAPCVGWAALHVARIHPQGVIAVLPADPHITDEPAYTRALEQALSSAQGGGLLTIGITPTRPETGYGYIEVGSALSGGVSQVKHFVEKPNRERAEEFMRAGTFLWNSGMFFFRADVILDAIGKHMPALKTFLNDCNVAIDRQQETGFVRERYATLESVSFDYGIMEKAADIRVLPASFGWYDIGSWTTAWELAPKDANGNAAPAGSVLVESKNCYVRSEGGKLIALLGVDDLVVVDTGDALLIMPRERAQDVRQVVDELKARKENVLV